MPRPLRIEYEGALYHVLNRGNYRRDVFETAGAAQAFITVLTEATARYRWRVHAYAVMRNHYHVALETVEPNLADGMHWLQSTLATRFNRLRRERGHLFQGRYQAILVENIAGIARLANYIHLNPVRAGIIPPEQVAAFRWSSLPVFVKGSRFAGMQAAEWMQQLGFEDNPAGWADYVKYLGKLAGNAETQKLQEFEKLSRGWAIGTLGWKRALAEEHSRTRLSPGVASRQARDLKEARWQSQLEKLLTETGRSLEEAAKARKGEPWKVNLAGRLQGEGGASVAWMARALHMGNPSSLRCYLSRANREKSTISALTPLL